jgi:hypothetical protein
MDRTGRSNREPELLRYKGIYFVLGELQQLDTTVLSYLDFNILPLILITVGFSFVQSFHFFNRLTTINNHTTFDMHSIKSIAPHHRHLCPTFAKLLSTSTRALSSRPFLQPKLTDSIKAKKTHYQSQRPFTPTSTTSMSTFSNADTGSKPADPYKQKNLDNHASLRDKVEDLVQFIDSSKFGMMTTRAQNGLLVSRCMALAAKVSSPNPPNLHVLDPRPGIRALDPQAQEDTQADGDIYRKAAASTSSSTRTPNPARRTTCTKTRPSTSPS